jgi:ATP-dependent Lon protease
MQESARAAMSYVRSHADQLGLDADFFEKSDFHLHIPAGAQPKDGPSAGVTIATALTSLISGRLVKPGLGMTGEITLRGQVLPIGGLKEKVLAAHRNGLHTVVLPKRNEPDLEDVPEEIQKAMQFILAENVEEVLAAALEPAKKKPRKTKSAKAKPKGSQARNKKLSMPED